MKTVPHCSHVEFKFTCDYHTKRSLDNNPVVHVLQLLHIIFSCMPHSFTYQIPLHISITNSLRLSALSAVAQYMTHENQHADFYNICIYHNTNISSFAENVNNKIGRIYSNT